MAKSLFLQIFTVAAALVLASAQAQTFLTNGLVAYYPFDGNANDASGHGNNGIVQGATLTTNGPGNRAYAFDGIQNRIQLPETIFGATNPAITVSAWVTTDNGPYSGTEMIFQKGSHDGEMSLTIDSNQFKFGPVLSDHSSIFIGTPLTSNSVTHLVGVYQQGQGVWLYTNGVLASSVTGIPNNTLWADSSGYPLVSAIGIYDFTPSPYDGFRGVIDNLRIYTRALPASEVQQLYQAESVPPPQIINFGLYPGVTVSGTVGFTYDIQSNPNLTNTNDWTTAGTVVLSQPVQLWVDTNNNAALPANPHRYYRVLAHP